MPTKVLYFGILYPVEEFVMKWQKRLFWYLFVSTVITFFNGIFLPVVPLPVSNFFIANLMYWFYYQQKHSLLVLFLFLSAIGIMVTATILIRKSMWKRCWFWIFWIMTIILYASDFFRNCYFIILAATTMPEPVKIISETIYSFCMAGDLVFIIFFTILIIRKHGVSHERR